MWTVKSNRKAILDLVSTNDPFSLFDINPSTTDVDNIMRLSRYTSGTVADGIGGSIDWYLENTEWLNNVTNGDYLKYYEEQYAKR